MSSSQSDVFGAWPTSPVSLHSTTQQASLSLSTSTVINLCSTVILLIELSTQHPSLSVCVCFGAPERAALITNRNTNNKCVCKAGLNQCVHTYQCVFKRTTTVHYKDNKMSHIIHSQSSSLPLNCFPGR